MKKNMSLDQSRAWIIRLTIPGLLILGGIILLLIVIFQESFITSNFSWSFGGGGGGFDIVVFDKNGNRHSLPFCEPNEYGLDAPLYLPRPELIRRYLIDPTQQFNDNDPYLPEYLANETTYIPPDELVNNGIEVWPLVMQVDPPQKFIRTNKDLEISARVEIGEKICEVSQDHEVENEVKRRAYYIAWKPPQPLGVTFNIDAPSFTYKEDNGGVTEYLDLIERSAEHTWILSPEGSPSGLRKILIEAEPNVGNDFLNPQSLSSIIEFEVRDPTGLSPVLLAWLGFIGTNLGLVTGFITIMKYMNERKKKTSRKRK